MVRNEKRTVHHHFALAKDRPFSAKASSRMPSAFGPIPWSAPSSALLTRVNWLSRVMPMLASARTAGLAIFGRLSSEPEFGMASFSPRWGAHGWRPRSVTRLLRAGRRARGGGACPHVGDDVQQRLLQV